MAYFGITSFGAQNYFAFNRPDQPGSPAATVRSRGAMPPDPESLYVTRTVGTEEYLDEPIPGTDVARSLKPHLKVTPKEAREYTSHEMLETAMKRHVRSAHSPQEKFRKPITTNSMYGWYAQDAVARRDAPLYRQRSFPIRSSAETKHAELMFRGY